jgi:methionyl-tRNA formyltransferase
MKVGLLAAPDLTRFRMRTLDPILKDPEFTISLAVIDDRPPASARTRLKNNLKRGRGGYVFVMAIKRAFAKREQVVDTERWCRENGIEIWRTQKPYEETTLEKIREYELDALLLVGGYGIVRKPLLEVTPIGVISYHHGDMRTFRGMPPALWELYFGSTEMGVTVQILSPGIDAGIPIVERRIPIDRKDNVAELEERALRLSEPMLYNALLQLADPSFVKEPLTELGPVYTLPNLQQWLRLQWRIRLRKLGLRNSTNQQVHH